MFLETKTGGKRIDIAQAIKDGVLDEFPDLEGIILAVIHKAQCARHTSLYEYHIMMCHEIKEVPNTRIYILGVPSLHSAAYRHGASLRSRPNVMSAEQLQK
eukprot:4778563-Karenia_brevis.AAC.1